ncbi:hypothetical protein QQF64_019482 [Cirrhinus molitorella]|uniref:Integrase catalytic domain-containing protein n=1 Tax=Cirrhinus molitorella TaxID=172907 RepID=A0ABR3LHX4_9TELE
MDQQLHHPGAERVLAELRRKYWVLRGRKAICRDTNEPARIANLLEHLDTDAFLLSLCHSIARRGKAYEILCDNGTNFTGVNRELQDAFSLMAPKRKKLSSRLSSATTPLCSPLWWNLGAVEGMLNSTLLG